MTKESSAMNRKRNGQCWNKTARLFLIVFGCTLIPTLSLAQQKTTTIIRENPWPNIDTRVEKLYNDGIDAADKKQWEKARKSFAKAFELDPRPQIAANLGNAELQLGKARDAAEHFDYFLSKDKEADPDARAEVKALLDSAALRIVIAKVTVDQVGADVFVNREFVGKSPLSRRLFLEPGEYTFEATMAGAKPGSQSLELERGASVGVKLIMGEATHGTVLANGSVQMKATERRDWRFGAAIGAGSLAIVGIGAGVVLSIIGKSASNDATAKLISIKRLTPNKDETICIDFVSESIKKKCDAYHEEARRADRLGALGIAGFVVGGLASVGVMILLIRPKAKENNLRIMPTIGQTQTGILLQGSF